MTPQELKNSILHLAIQGKLVEQRPEEGTAQELYAQIQAEKQRFIKEGKIKKEKPLPEIIEDEKPFDIPEGWMWVRLGNIINLLSGQDMKPSEYNDKQRGIPYITGASNIINAGIIINRWTENARAVAHRGDLLLTCKGTVGKMIVLHEAQVHIARQIMAITPYFTDVDFIRFFVERQINNLKSQAKSMIPGIERKNVMDLALPLPPLAEQHRIVAKIEELLPLVDRYEQAWTKLEDFNRRFPEDLKKSILQQAIQGKLVEQRPEEGTAQELYEQIQAEKRRLVKEGKIKKEKPLPEITDEEKPFDVPEGWRWVRLGTLTETITSGSRDWAKYYSKTGDIFLRMGNLSKNSFDLRLDKIQRVTVPKSTEGKRTSLQAGDLLFSITGDVGMLGLIPPNFGVAYINQHTAMLRFMEKERNRYIPYLLLTDYAQKFYNGNQHGIKNSFRLDSIAWLPVPLPPLAEQKRIVERVEELLAMCERLKKE